MIIFHLENAPRTAVRSLRGPAAAVCRREALGLLRRDARKYARILAALYLGHWRVARWRLRLLRACYFYFRLLDDVVDGDRTCAISAEALLEEQRARWHGAPPESDEVEANLLFEHLWAELAQHSLPSARVRSLGAALLEGLRWDLQRRGEHFVPSADEMDAYYEQVILASAQIALAILGVREESAELRELALLIGRLQSVRDLSSDLRAGVINMPREARGSASPEDRDRWCDREVEQCLPRMNELWAGLRSPSEWRSRLVFGSAVKTLQRWARTHKSGSR